MKIKTFQTKIFLSVGILLSLILSCTNQKEVSMNVVPNIEISSIDSRLSQQQGIVYLQKRLFSGFVIEKYKNGEIASKNSYFQGKLEGKQEKFYADGSKMEVRFYKENRKDGTHTGWWENGKMKFEYFIKSDVPVATHREFYPNGQIYSLNTYNAEGQPEGKQQMWYETGQIKANYVIKNGRRFGFLGAKGCMGEGEKKKSQLSFGVKGK